MQVTLLETGSSIPNLARAGTALTVAAGEEPILIDCGPRTVYR